MSSQESPFVGCRIRIISKAKIRYEGFLHSIDTDAPDDPVITLSKVWSFGTEDRPSERFVGPRNEVYEQIVFRGRDLEDVRVLQSSVFLNEDPSIVSAVPGSGGFSATKPREENDAPDPWSVTPFGDVKKPEIPPDFARPQYDGHEEARRDNRFRRGGGRPAGQPRGGGRQRFRPWDEGVREPLSKEFEGEYDIEKANAELAEELEKIEISSGNANGSTSGPLEETETEEKVCYDSKKSFFDTLSSELMDRAQG
ncbi:unnamed protein product [Dibothriocephalus latus]|uniref:FFD box profile domain-containing protein n=1 Tax=Dibothriocephalus latus TaxID=60516 RepID=A0A3P7LQ02_DIBLA|nr:unnamed protein product [Dibothriocephalus latus]